MCLFKGLHGESVPYETSFNRLTFAGAAVVSNAFLTAPCYVAPWPQLLLSAFFRPLWRAVLGAEATKALQPCQTAWSPRQMVTMPPDPGMRLAVPHDAEGFVGTLQEFRTSTSRRRPCEGGFAWVAGLYSSPAARTSTVPVPRQGIVQTCRRG